MQICYREFVVINPDILLFELDLMLTERCLTYKPLALYVDNPLVKKLK